MRVGILLGCTLIVATAVAAPSSTVTGAFVGDKRIETTKLVIDLANSGDRPVRVTEVRVFGCAGTGHATIVGGVKVPAHATRRQRIEIEAITSTVTVPCGPDDTWS